MKATRQLRILLALCAASIGANACRNQISHADIAATRRHVLLLTIDTLRADYLSASGYDLPTSPFLDRLRADSFDFARAVTPIPRTTPALASLLTGAYPRTTAVRNLVDALPRQLATLPELARRRGYHTLAVVSNHILTPDRGLDRGFDVYDFADDSRDAVGTTDAALERLESYARIDPLFVWVHYVDPHVPYYPPPELAARFDPSYDGPYRTHFGTRKGGVGDQAYPEDLGKAKAVFRNSLPPAVNAHIRRLYAADIRHTDDQVARLLESLRQRFGDDWLVVFTADHGESLGENQYFFDHGDYVSNAEIRVPLSFLLPAGDPLRGRRVIGDWVSLVDVAPTVIELLGLEPARTADGRSLVPYMKGEELPARPVFAESGESFFPHLIKRRSRFDVSGRLRTVLLGDLKLVWAPGQQNDQEYDLFDLGSENGETVDVHDRDPARADALKQALHQWADATNTGSQAIAEGDRERLRALGYVE